MSKYTDKQRQRWMRRLQTAVKNSGGDPGKIDWDTANHLYNTGESCIAAAQAIVELQTPRIKSTRPPQGLVDRFSPGYGEEDKEAM